MLNSSIGKCLRQLPQFHVIKNTRKINDACTTPRCLQVEEFKLNGLPVSSRKEGKRKVFVPVENWQWFADSKEGPSGSGTVRQSGGGLGKLDSANEDGFFYKLNKSRLKKLKQLLKDKDALKSKETPDKKPGE